MRKNWMQRSISTFRYSDFIISAVNLSYYSLSCPKFYIDLFIRDMMSRGRSSYKKQNVCKKIRFKTWLGMWRKNAFQTDYAKCSILLYCFKNNPPQVERIFKIFVFFYEIFRSTQAKD